MTLMQSTVCTLLPIHTLLTPEAFVEDAEAWTHILRTTHAVPCTACAGERLSVATAAGVPHANTLQTLALWVLLMTLHTLLQTHIRQW
jgi:hypothetical protein